MVHTTAGIRMVLTNYLLPQSYCILLNVNNPPFTYVL